MAGNLWSVVLAAGSGRRLSPLTGRVPKQFWRPDGGPSLIEGTVDRLAPICPAERTVIVVGEEHRDYVRRWPGYRTSGRILFQPLDRGTAAGVLFGLLPIVATDPEAVVVVTPSDHGVRNSVLFRQGLLEAVTHAQHPGGVVLFGVEPTGPREDYGWISIDAAKVAVRIRGVRSFAEKPDVVTARRLYANGSVWNTMVFVARARALIDLCRSQQPQLTATFEHALTRPRDARHTFLAARYSALQSVDFSRDVLADATGLWAYTWPASMGWSDLGTPERFLQWFQLPELAQMLVTSP